jgi:B9 domain-containing protein 2
MTLWAHPIDVHFKHSSMQGWPRILVQVWSVDSYGRSDLIANGFGHIPAAVRDSSLDPPPPHFIAHCIQIYAFVQAGSFEIECPTWRPSGSESDEWRAFFLGGVPQLLTDEVLFNQAWDDRSKLVTVPSGKVHVQVDVLLRYAKEQNMSWGQ